MCQTRGVGDAVADRHNPVPAVLNHRAGERCFVPERVARTERLKRALAEPGEPISNLVEPIRLVKAPGRAEGVHLQIHTCAGTERTPWDKMS